MDINERSAIENEIEVLRMSAHVAAEARYEEVVEFVKHIVSSVNEDVKIEKLEYANEESMSINRVRLILDELVPGSSKATTWRFSMTFQDDYRHDNELVVVPSMHPAGIYEFSYGSLEHKIIKISYAVGEALPELSKLVNSEQFKHYREDIKAYLDAKKRLASFDKDAFEEKVQDIIKSFKSDQVLKDSNYKYHTIKKVTRKRLYMSNLWNNRQSLPKDQVARWIALTNWQFSV